VVVVVALALVVLAKGMVVRVEAVTVVRVVDAVEVEDPVIAVVRVPPAVRVVAVLRPAVVAVCDVGSAHPTSSRRAAIMVIAAEMKETRLHRRTLQPEKGSKEGCLVRSAFELIGSVGLLLAAFVAIAVTSRRAVDRRSEHSDRRWFLPVAAAGLFTAAAAVQVVWRIGQSLLPWERLELLLLMAAAAVAVGAAAACGTPRLVSAALSLGGAVAAPASAGRGTSGRPGGSSDVADLYLGSSHGTIVRSLAAAVDVRDRYTHSHSRLVSELSAATAQIMGLHLQEIGRVRVGALLHDVGKIGVPDAILSKRGHLTSEEWESVRMHPVLGKTIIEQAPELRAVIPLVLHHQERFDGSGYPGRLCGREIPLGARIIAVADAYHAMRSDRPYRAARSHAETVPELLRCSGTQFDPDVVSALLRALDSDRRLEAMMMTAAGPASASLPYTGLN
jgi:HD-GYP domain-containing protein (c-di-GMP phosphodiesterase class II)